MSTNDDGRTADQQAETEERARLRRKLLQWDTEHGIVHVPVNSTEGREILARLFGTDDDERPEGSV